MADYYSRLEDSGYEAGLAGKPLEESSLWSQVWSGPPGTNFIAYIIAGWVAGRAMRRIGVKKAESDGP